jgi:hypothetical protein
MKLSPPPRWRLILRLYIPPGNMLDSDDQGQITASQPIHKTTRAESPRRDSLTYSAEPGVLPTRGGTAWQAVGEGRRLPVRICCLAASELALSRVREHGLGRP